MQRHPRSILLNLALASLVTATVVQPVLAVNGSDHQSAQKDTSNTGRGSGSSDKLAQLKTEVASRAAELKAKQASKSAALKEKLEGQKLQSCEKRQQKIQDHIERAATQSQKHLDTFSSIADKVGAFKTGKGISVDNYADLQQRVDLAKTEAEAAVVALKQAGTDFSCSSDGPRAQLQSVKEATADVRSALKAYRSAVKDLIQGVRQANGQHRESSPSATPNGGSN